MTSVFVELAERMKAEMADLEDAVTRAARAWARSDDAAVDKDIYLDSVALNLHGFYSGLERLFELIARHIDQVLPSGETWHRDLLARMCHDIADVRPAVVSEKSERQLDALRRFRHLVRNVYATNLVPEKLASLVDGLREHWPGLQAELLAFAQFLEYVARDED
ncbi:MAG TPA: antitoxin [Syntrophobacteria bacterium]|nr:antitoxin [Syntrophobacteria bacterium]